MKELIKQDVDRTCQEFEYFRRKSTKDALMAMLYLWGKENEAYGYKIKYFDIKGAMYDVITTESLHPILGKATFLDKNMFLLFFILIIILISIN